MAVQINGTIVSNKDTKKIEKSQQKGTTSLVGREIWFIGEPCDLYRLYKGKIVRELKDDMVEVNVRTQHIGDDPFLEHTLILPLKKIRFEKK